MSIVFGLICANLVCALQKRVIPYDIDWKAPKPAGNDLVVIAALHYLVTNKSWATYFDFKKKRNFLSVDKKDPSDFVIRSFHFTHRFYKGSGCNDTHEGVFENDSKKPATLTKMDVSSPKGDKVFVDFWLRSVGWGGGGTRLTVSKVKDEWTVIHQGQIQKG